MQNGGLIKTELFANRYALQEEIGAGGMGVIYRAQDRLTGKFVALKQLPRTSEFILTTTVNDHDSTRERIALEREFEVLSALHHPHIIQVQDYGFFQGDPYFTMDLLEDSQDIKSYAQNLALPTKIDLVIQVLESLAYIHQRGIVHHDIKPRNILVKDEHVYLLDFGLSLKQGHQHPKIAGTFTYLAPETLIDKTSSMASDLYSVGILIYEILTGERPYQAQRITDLIDEIMYGTLNFDAITQLEEENLRTKTLLAKVLEQLLVKRPQERYPDAKAVIDALNEALDRPAQPEPADIRESYLQFADFVGRKHELSLLNDALMSTLNGNGSLWFVGGDSGVGKSRLVSEIERLSKVWGAVVLRGQGEQFTRLPYEYWREPLRRLILMSEITASEAGILKRILPNIDELLQTSILEAPELEPNNEEQRLIFTIADIFSRINTPLVLILEDLHWANESLKILQAIQSQLADLPLLILATYQSYVTPDLSKSFANCHDLQLEQFNYNEIAEFTTAILGEHHANAEIINFLETETVGNAFFIVEILRALAEESGELRTVPNLEMPTSITTSGIRDTILARLHRYPENFLALLSVAGVMGQQLDTALLEHIVQTDSYFAKQFPHSRHLQDWLATAANASILRLAHEHWQFAHSKLREVLLETIDETQRSSLHRVIAESYEAVYPANDDYAATLFYHWREAQNESKEIKYALIVARQLNRLSEYPETIRYAEKALAKLADDNDQQRADFTEILGRAYVAIGDSEKATHYLEESIVSAQKAGDIYLEAQACTTLGWMYHELSHQKDEAQTILERALELATELKDEQLKADALVQYGTFWLLTEQYEKTLAPTIEAIVIYTEYDNQAGLGRAYNLRALHSLKVKDYGEAQEYFNKCQTKADYLGDRWMSAAISNNLSILYYELDELDKAEEHGEKTLAIYRRLNSPWRIMLISRILTYIGIKRQDPTRIKPYLSEALEISLMLENTVRIASNLCLAARYFMILQQYTKACHTIGLCLNVPDLISRGRDECATMLDEIEDWLDAEEIATHLDAVADWDIRSFAEKILIQLKSDQIEA